MRVFQSLSLHSVPIYHSFFSFSINFFLIEMTTYKKKIKLYLIAHLHLNFTICLTTLNISWKCIIPYVSEHIYALEWKGHWRRSSMQMCLLPHQRGFQKWRHLSLKAFQRSTTRSPQRQDQLLQRSGHPVKNNHQGHFSSPIWDKHYITFCNWATYIFSLKNLTIKENPTKLWLHRQGILGRIGNNI